MLIALAVLPVVVGAAVLVALRPWASEGAPADEGGAPAGARAVTILAAGDIGRCNESVDEATAQIVERFPDATVLALGDLAYNRGSAEEFEQCFDASWGQFTDRTYPVPGNHEYRTDSAGAYFDYFGDRAGEPGKGWYSFRLGAWHVVALNSNCADVGCEAGSEQERWLRDELEASDARCTLAFSHHPRFSSGREHGGAPEVRDLWYALLDHGVELLLSGHEHLYERTAPLDATGEVAPATGVRQFVVGTGGGNFYELGDRVAGSEAAIVDTGGVLRMTLDRDGYQWEFLPVASDGPSDSGSDECR